MKDLIKKDWNYRFYENNGEYYLSVLCGTVGLFDVLVKLTENQIQLYKKDGELFLDKFAQEIRDSPSQYMDS